MPENETRHEADFEVGPRAITAYSRLSYSMWYALAEFIDNSTQSRINFAEDINPVLGEEGTPLVVEVTYDRVRREIRISDNSIGMSYDELIEALRVASPTFGSKGRSKYGMGMKTAACWIGNKWKVITSRLGRPEEWTATVDVDRVASGERIPLASKAVSADSHYTKIVISDLNRTIGGRTEENVVEYLRSMYRFDLMDGQLKLVFNGDPLAPPDDREFDTDENGNPYKRALPETTISGHKVNGWIGVLKKGSGGRKYGGFSLFQNRRQIEGFPNAWKPQAIYGGIDNEGANNLISQRLTGVIELDGFDVSHTKDAILFRDGEREALEKFLFEQSKDYRDYASRRRGESGRPWSRDKVKELLEGMKEEFTNNELKDAGADLLPPLDTILENNRSQVEGLSAEDEAVEYQVLPDLRVIVSLKQESDFEPYLVISAGADAGVLHVIINNLHPYYADVESPDAREEALRQFIYDAIAEYYVSKQYGQVTPASTRRKKDSLLRAKALHAENAAIALQNGQYEVLVRPPEADQA